MSGRIRLFPAVGVAALGAALAAILLSPRTEAQVPDAVQAAQQRLASAQRLYLMMFIPIGRSDTAQYNRVALRYDLDARALALDGVGFRYLYADGIATYHNTLFGQSPARRLPLAEPLLADFLAELDTGLANSRWIPELPPGALDRPSDHWYRVDLPFEWDDAYRIYFDIKPERDAVLDQLEVYYADVDEVVLLQHPPATDPRIGTRFYPRILFRYAHWDPDFGTSLHGFPPEPFEQRTYMNPPRLYEVEYEGGPPEPDTF